MCLLLKNKSGCSVLIEHQGLTSLETQFVSVERVAEYTRMVGERETESEAFAPLSATGAAAGVTAAAPPPPSRAASSYSSSSITTANYLSQADFLPKGSVELRDVKMRYRFNKPLVLNVSAYVLLVSPK